MGQPVCPGVGVAFALPEQTNRGGLLCRPTCSTRGLQAQGNRDFLGILAIITLVSPEPDDSSPVETGLWRIKKAALPDGKSG